MCYSHLINGNRNENEKKGEIYLFYCMELNYFIHLKKLECIKVVLGLYESREGAIYI